MLEALEKLRWFIDDQFVVSGQAYLYGMAIVGSIQNEIDANYMRLPVDADGMSIHVGDSVNMEDSDKEFTVHLVGDTCFRGQLLGTGAMETHYSRCCRHVKPRTLEDVLADFAADVENDRNNIETARKYADEIRELLGGDAE